MGVEGHFKSGVEGHSELGVEYPLVSTFKFAAKV